MQTGKGLLAPGSKGGRDDSGNLETTVGSAQIAKRRGLSAGYFSALFKQETGVGVTTFIRRQKLGRAKRLIRAGNLSDGEIAGRLGFCSQSFFIRCFKQEYGMTPRRYRLTPGE